MVEFLRLIGFGAGMALATTGLFIFARIGWELGGHLFRD